MSAQEVNFDGLVGPTHNYAGLSYGNVASTKHRHQVANPKQAALQGLQKMFALVERGFIQGIIPPHERPHIPSLKRLGFRGSETEILAQVAREVPYLLASMSSASAMWTANAATVSPSTDTADGKVHFTPANLHNKFHRSLEAAQTGRILRTIFANPNYFVHHEPLPSVSHLGDEGAANHTRFCASYGSPGVELFVYGRRGFAEDNPDKIQPLRYPARQTLEASQAIARLHGLSVQRTIFAQQSPAAIDAGVFHNDVIAVGNKNVLFFHQQAFFQQPRVIASLQDSFAALNYRDQSSVPFVLLEVPASAVPIEDVVQSYLFNSQLLSLPGQKMLLLVPEECQQNPRVWAYLQDLLRQNTPISEIFPFNLRESMHNGGGPACLRLRVVLSAKELAGIRPTCLLNSERYQQLTQWVEKHYRDRLTEADLADPQLLMESRTALDDLTRMLDLGSLYEFQSSPE